MANVDFKGYMDEPDSTPEASGNKFDFGGYMDTDTKKVAVKEPVVSQKQNLISAMENFPREVMNRMQEKQFGLGQYGPDQPLPITSIAQSVAQPGFLASNVIPAARNVLQTPDYPDLLREMNFPGAKSESVGVQSGIQALGVGAQIGLDPYAWVAPEALRNIGKGMALNPATRRYIQRNMPNMAKNLLQNNPVEPVMRNVNGMNVDITKPLPDESGNIAKIGRSWVGKIHGLVKSWRNKYGKLLKPFYEKAVPDEQISNLPPKVLEELGYKAATPATTAETGIVLPGGGQHIATTPGKPATRVTIKDLWEGRWNLQSLLNESSTAKTELLTRLKVSEKELMNAIKVMKETVLNNVDDATKVSIEKLDPDFGVIIKSSRSILRSIYDAKANKIKTGPVNAFFNKKPTHEGSVEIFNRLKFFEKSLGTIQKKMEGELFKQMMGKAARAGAIGVGGLGVAGAMASNLLKPIQRSIKNIGFGGEGTN